MTGAEDLLCCILNCGTADLSLLDDVQYDMGDLYKELAEDYGGVVDINDLMRRVFERGYEDISEAVEARLGELEQLLHDGCIEDDEREELLDIRELDPMNDFESYHNCLDTHVWCNAHAGTYRRYFGEALDEFCENTGFYISCDGEED